MKQTVRAITLMLMLCVTLGALTGCDGAGLLGPLEREGPPALVAHAGEGEPRLWLLYKQEEHPRNRLQPRTRYNFELHGFDTKTAQRLWTKRLRTVGSKEGGHNARARILGKDGALIWLFLHNQAVALSSADGAVLADRERLEAVNPQLKGLLSAELKFYTFDAGLVVITVDARRFRISAADFKAHPYTPAKESEFDRLSYMSSQWNGGYQTKDFRVRQGMLWGRWIGMHTEKEAGDVGNDKFGDRIKNPYGSIDEGAQARRTLWTARIGKTEQFSEGKHDRLFDVTRLPGAPEFLQGGFFIRQGTRQALQLREPDAVLILHRTRIDAQGRLALTRLDGQFREQWKTVLPYIELTNRWEFADRLLLMGAEVVMQRGVAMQVERILAVSLADGRVQLAQ